MSLIRTGTNVSAASREAADRASKQSARPGTDPYAVSRATGPEGANMPGNAAGRYNPAYGMIDADGTSYQFFKFGVTHFNDTWRFGPPS